LTPAGSPDPPAERRGSRIFGTFGPPNWRGRRRTLISEVIALDRSYVLEEVVRAWAEMALPDQTALADRAVALAIDFCEAGGSVQAACRQVSEFVGCWVRHPATQKVESRALVRLAS